jgi:F0F1-type ATP synthase membrane subunit b/b'
MNVLALTSTQESLWWVTLGLAVIVLLAVAAFLTLLVSLVRTIEERVDQIRETLDQAEANTSDSALIAETADRVDAVLAEGLEHHLFLGRVLDKVRS